jgi:NDP-sugar pyrophosphorylase family protein
MISIILAGGQGLRLGLDQNKSSLTFLSKTLLDHNIDLLSPYSKEIIIVGGHYSDTLTKYQNNKNIKILLNVNGVVDAIREAIAASNGDNIFLCFSDEIVINPNLSGMMNLFHKELPIAVIGYCNRTSESQQLIHNTFSIETDQKNQVTQIVEKPKLLINQKQGTSYAILSKKILNYFNPEIQNYPDILQAAIDKNETVIAFEFCKEFFNNNTPQDLKRMKKFEDSLEK